MTSKMTTHNYQQKTKTKQTIRTGAESQQWTSHGRLSAGRGRGKNGEKVQRIRNIIGRHKIYRGRLRIA